MKLRSSSNLQDVYAHNESSQLGLQVGEVVLVAVDVLQGFVAELLLKLQRPVRPLVDVLPDLVVLRLALLLLQIYLAAFDGVIDPIG